MKDLAFSEDEYCRRFDLVCDMAKERKIDYLLITEPSHVCWLSGFDPTGLFYKNQLHIDVKSGDAAVMTHRAEEKMAAMNSWIDRLLIWHHGSNPMLVAVDHAKKYLAGAGEKVVGMNLQTPYFPIADYYAIRGSLGNVGVVDVTKMIDDARMKKSEPSPFGLLLYSPIFSNFIIYPNLPFEFNENILYFLCLCSITIPSFYARKVSFGHWPSQTIIFFLCPFSTFSF